MKILTKDLLKSIRDVGVAAKSKTTLPILNHVRLEATGGVLTLAASSIETFIVRRVACEGDLAPVCVKFATIERAVSFESVEHLTIEMNRRLKITGKSSTTLSVLDANEFPPGPSVQKRLAVSPSDLADGLCATSFAAGLRKDDRTGVMIVTMHPKELRCVGFGAVVLAVFSRAIICEDRTFYIEADQVEPLSAALRENQAQPLMDGNWIAVEHEFGMCAVKLSEQAAYNPDLMLELKFGPEISLSKDVLIRSCNYAEALNESGSAEASLVKFEFGGEKLTVSARGKSGDWVEEFEVESQKEKFVLDASILLKSLKNADGPIIRVSVNDSAVKFTFGDSIIYVARNRGMD